MKNNYTNYKTWRLASLSVLGALLMLCTSTVFAQTTFGPYAETPGIDLTAFDDGYDGSLGGTSTASDTTTVSGVTGDILLDIQVEVAISHTWVGDLAIKLEAPDGTVMGLMSAPDEAEPLDDGLTCCGSSTDWLTLTPVVFADSATTDAETMGTYGSEVCSGDSRCSYFPNQGSMAGPSSFADLVAILGTPAATNGEWKLHVGDMNSGDNGVFESWSVTIITASPSFDLVKTVNLEPDPSGLGCFDLPVATEQSIGVNVGDSVCYWYTVTNTGDVDFDLIDFIDDQLIPTGILGAPGFDLTVGSSIAIPWSSVPTEILAEVTNTVDITYYNSALGISAGPETDQATVGIIPANDECSGAIPLDCGVPVTGSTQFSTDAGNSTECAQFIDDLTVWYSFVGTGNPVQLTTCGSTTDGSSQAYIAVFEGTCGSLVCESGGSPNQGLDPDCGFANSQLVQLETTPGTTYYVTVTEALGFPGVIDFDLTLNCLAPANDNVCDAAALSAGPNGPFYNETATVEIGEPLPPGTGCQTTDGWCTISPEPVLDNTTWYTFVAPASGNVTLSTDFSGHDTQLAVYSAASCADVLTGGATLVGANDDSPNSPTTLFSSELTLPCLTPGETYFVQVDGYQGAFGGVMIELTDNGGTPVSAVLSGGGLSCDGADVATQIDFTGVGPWDVTVEVDGIPQTFTGLVDNPSIITANFAGTFVLTEVTDQGTGCTAAGSGTAVVTEGESPVAAFTNVPTDLSVDFTDASTGAPTDWAWDFGDGNTSIMQNPTHVYAAGGTYTVCLIAMNDCDLDGDTICETVTVTSPTPANDLCSNAEVVACGDVVIASTATATATDASVCQPTGLGVWYHFVGTGDDVTISTDNAGTDFDTYLGVTESCGAATCFASDDDGGTGTTSVVEFSSVLGQDYFIQVSSYNGTLFGNFEMTITCTPPPTAPANDNVCDAAALVLGSNTGFTNVAATVEVDEPNPGAGTGANTCQSQDGWCSFELVLDNTIWFTFEGPASGNLIIDTDGSDDDTQIAAYSAASCQDFPLGTAVQLAANDDNPDYITTQFSSIIFLCGLTPGETYYLQVDGYQGAEGAVVVNLTETTLDADYTYAATGLDVTFGDMSATSTSIVSWEWDFGDGNISTDQNPSHTYALDGSYTVCLTVTDENGCTSTFCNTVQVAGPVSIAEAVDYGMEIFPNPSNGQFVITVKGVEADVQIVVMDVAGRQVYNEGAVLSNSFRKELNLDVAKGTYLLQIATLEGLVTRKIQVH